MPAPPVVDVVDSTWIGASAAAVGAAIADPANWRRWWPALDLHADELRGAKGVRWTVRAVGGSSARGLLGTAEVWLQPEADGVVAHFFLRLNPPPGTVLDARTAARVVDEYRRLTKRAFWALGDHLDPGRFTRHTSASHTSVT